MDDKAKLRVLVEHWIEHNDEHSAEFSQWAEKAKSFGAAEAGEDILAAVSQLEAASRSLTDALRKLG